MPIPPLEKCALRSGGGDGLHLRVSVWDWNRLYKEKPVAVPRNT